MPPSSAPTVALWRPITATLVVLSLLGFVGHTLWEQDWKWGLPTERPANLKQPSVGARLDLPETSTRITYVT